MLGFEPWATGCEVSRLSTELCGRHSLVAAHDGRVKHWYEYSGIGLLYDLKCAMIVGTIIEIIVFT